VKIWELRVTLEDGRTAACPVLLNFDPKDFSREGFAAVVPLAALIKDRMYDSYLVLNDFVTPPPELPKELEDV